jgi:hypothetical protein
MSRSCGSTRAGQQARCLLRVEDEQHRVCLRGLVAAHALGAGCSRPDSVVIVVVPNL